MEKDTSNAGRPTVMTAEVISKLEAAYSNDMTDLEACLYADIAPRTLYDYQEKNPEFVQRKKSLKQALSMHAKNHIAKKITADDDATIKWWLERRRKDEFSLRQEQTGADGAPLMPAPKEPLTPEQAAAAYAEALNSAKPKTE